MHINPPWSNNVREHRLFRRILAWFGYRIEYICEWGEYDSRYNECDWFFSRPIHEHMSVAPPWAKRKFVKI